MTDTTTADLARIIKEHPFFAGLDEKYRAMRQLQQQLSRRG
jgi:hypothetical protein